VVGDLILDMQENKMLLSFINGLHFWMSITFAFWRFLIHCMCLPLSSLLVSSH